MKGSTSRLRTENLSLASFLDELLPMRGNNIVSYHEDMTGLDGTHQNIMRFADLHREIDIMSRFLVEKSGLKRGDRVAIYKTNDPSCFRWFMAVIRAGGIAVPLNPLLSLVEVRSITEQCGVGIMVTDRPLFDRNILSTDTVPVPVWIQSDSGPSIGPSFLRISDQDMDKPFFGPMPVGPDETVAIFHTSGTGGVPKGAMLSSRSLLAGAATASLIAPFIRKKELALFALPWAHIMAVSTALYGLVAGIPALFLGRFDTERVIELIERYRVTSFIGVPAMFIKLMNASPAMRKLSSIRLWISASDHLPRPYRNRLLRYGALYRLLGRRLVPPLFINIYGMVELGGSAMIGIHIPFIPGSSDLCIPVPPHRIRIIDKDGNEARRGRIGECQVKGPGVTDGYWENREGTCALLTEDGWLRTGDLAVRNLLGLIRLMGRSKDVIKCGGYSVFASEIENVLAEHHAVTRVAVIGVPHPQKGEVPIGIVETAGGSSIDETELVSWCRTRLAPYKTPRRIHVVAEGEMPRGVTEKVLKRELRERYDKGFLL